MNETNFDKCFHNLLGHEGSYSNHSNDPGGETMWGVTAVVARANGYKGSMRNLPVELAKRIYRKQYWDAIQLDDIPKTLQYGLFDAGVNSGTTQAVKWLQRALEREETGVVTAELKAAAIMSNQEQVLMKMLGYRLQFMTDLRTWGSFGKGWARRIASLLKDGGN